MSGNHKLMNFMQHCPIKIRPESVILYQEHCRDGSNRTYTNLIFSLTLNTLPKTFQLELKVV